MQRTQRGTRVVALALDPLGIVGIRQVTAMCRSARPSIGDAGRPRSDAMRSSVLINGCAGGPFAEQSWSIEQKAGGNQKNSECSKLEGQLIKRRRGSTRGYGLSGRSVRSERVQKSVEYQRTS